MTAMHPDSGVPSSDAKNSIPESIEASVNCQELWYSTSRCQPRFDPAAANAVLAELINLINKGEVTYDCNFLDQVQLATRYLIQRGLPRACFMVGGPNAYTGVLDPPCTRYNDYMTLTVVPAANNASNGTTLDAGRGAAYILRNDGAHLERDDLVTGKPAIIAFYSGNWHMCSIVASQVPIIKKGGIDCWIRTDGNDTTGDGTANDPAKAFKTIAGCWAAVGSRYAATPMFSINMRLGIPGTYTAAIIGPFGGQVTLTGDPANPSGYKLDNQYFGAGIWCSLWVQSISNMQINGVTFQATQSAQTTLALRCINSDCNVANSRFEAVVNNPRSYFVEVTNGGLFVSSVGTMTFAGNGNQMGGIFVVGGHGGVVGAYLDFGQRCDYYFDNMVINAASFIAAELATMMWASASSFNINNVTGPQFSVVENSIINMGGKPCPGTLSGTVGSGGRFIP